MRNSETTEQRFSRRALLTGGVLTEKEKVILVSPIPLYATIYRSEDVDRIDLLSLQGQQKTIRKSGAIGAKLGAAIGALCVVGTEETPRRKFIKKVINGACEGSATGLIFGSSIAPLMGATGLVDVHIVQPLLKGISSQEALENLQIEKKEAEMQRNT
ncbi:MAG: hypothetical protein RLZZ455_78 [Candidatus Parcubacteria bacterium]|jgi:hypothetical protein